MIFFKLGKSISSHLGLSACVSIISGLIVGNMCQPVFLKALIPIALFLMLYPAMLDIETDKIRKTVTEPEPLITALLLNFIFSPFLMFGLSRLILSEPSASLAAGILIFGIIPCGGMVPAYTGMLRGNINLSVTVTALSLFLGIGIIPLWAKLLIGRFIPVPFVLIIKYLAVIIIIPLFSAELTRRFFVRKKGFSGFVKVKQYLKVLTGYGFMLLLFVVFVLNGRLVASDPVLILKILFPVCTFLIILLVCSTLLGRILQLCYEDSVALTISTTAKNNALAIALAISVFGPEAALVIAVTGPLVQLPVMLGYLKVAKYAAKTVHSRS